MSKFRYKLYLQQFAESIDENGFIDFGEDDDDDGVDFDFDNLGEDSDEDDDSGEPADKQPENESEPEPEKKEEPEPEPEPEKKPEQSAEENAKFAEMRRQKQAEERAQAALKDTPEYKLAQSLADMYGVDVPTMLQRIEDAKIAKQAETQGKTVEQVKAENAEKQRVQALEDEVYTLKFQAWSQSKALEIADLKTKYPMLSDDDFEEAKTYMLGTLRDPIGSISRAVFALHGEKILSAQADQAKTEALAEVSGRKKGPMAPQGRAPSATETLSEQERYFAKQMGISEADYLKYK